MNIDNVREWMKEAHPDEPLDYKEGGVDKGLTFSWIMEHMGEHGWMDKFDIDTQPREYIATEAVHRMLLKMQKGGFCRKCIQEQMDKIEWVR